MALVNQKLLMKTLYGAQSLQTTVISTSETLFIYLFHFYALRVCAYTPFKSLGSVKKNVFLFLNNYFMNTKAVIALFK